MTRTWKDDEATRKRILLLHPRYSALTPPHFIAQQHPPLISVLHTQAALAETVSETSHMSISSLFHTTLALVGRL